MSIRVRQLVFLLVLFASIVGLVWILLYSAGYGFSFRTWQLVPTGSIRVAIEPRDDALIFLLPEGGSYNNDDASFTHLLPGTYRLHAEIDHYYPVNLEITVEPNTTVIVDPLYLWPMQSAQLAPKAIVQPQPTSIADIDIEFQAAISQLDIPAEQIELLDLHEHGVIVTDTTSHTAQWLESSGHAIKTHSLGSANRVATTNDSDVVLLISAFSLQRFDLTSANTETVLRISQPISAANWITGTPYVAYSIGTDLHIMDSRRQTNYADQLVAQLPANITALWYDVDREQIMVELSNSNLYSWSIRYEAPLPAK
jgi:hypothetical protein